MTAGIVATGLLFFPAAPFFLFMHGKDIAVPKSAEVTAYINGDVRLETSKFAPKPIDGSASSSSSQATGTSQSASSVAPPTGSIDVRSNPDGAEVYADNTFIGNCPATLKRSPGQHTIRVTQAGYKDWSRDIALQNSSDARLTATMEKLD